MNTKFFYPSCPTEYCLPKHPVDVCPLCWAAPGGMGGRQDWVWCLNLSGRKGGCGDAQEVLGRPGGTPTSGGEGHRQSFADFRKNECPRTPSCNMEGKWQWSRRAAILHLGRQLADQMTVFISQESRNSLYSWRVHGKWIYETCLCFPTDLQFKTITVHLLKNYGWKKMNSQLRGEQYF